MSAKSMSMSGGDRFSFGKNWASFIENLTDDRIEAAMSSLTEILQLDILEGKSFLDIGCGSGLFSLAAMKLNASKVHSFDFDLDSVSCAGELKHRFFSQSSDWCIEKGDAIDESYMTSLGTFDIVYAFGVLHHTGDMWKALNLATLPVRQPGGKLFIAIYNDTGIRSRFWRKVKQVYCSLPSSLRTAYVMLFLPGLEGPVVLRNILKGKHPWQHWREYYKRRGMSRWHDILDWLGGYPYEFAKPDELFEFYRSKGFRLDRFVSTYSLGNNQMLFTRI